MSVMAPILAISGIFQILGLAVAVFSVYVLYLAMVALKIYIRKNS